MMLSCKEVSELVSKSLDQDLPFFKRIGIRIHFLMCQHCKWYSEHMLFLRDVILSYQEKIQDPGILPSVVLPDDARQRIKMFLNEEQG